jgi:H+-translocating NAD(P) transhydrogenase subunit alpha
MKLAVPREIQPGEQRVALAPESCKKLVQAGIDVTVQSGAGAAAFFDDAAYQGAGAALEPDATALLGDADLVLKVQPPVVDPVTGRHEVDLLKPEAMLLGTLIPSRHLALIPKLIDRRITAFSTDLIPRTTRAQAMDTLSSMANIAGYKGVLLAAAELPRYFPMFMTAAGTVFAAKVFVIGAGVAGLQAIATAKRLGATVIATDVRPEVKEQIESVGARFVGVITAAAQAGGGYAAKLSDDFYAKQRELLAEQCAQADVVVTTALIGGVTAPKLITADMVRKMRPGSVIVDLAAEGGGNCELSQPGQTTTENGVRILAPLNLPATVPNHASLLYSRNLTSFVQAFWKKDEKRFNLDWTDDILSRAVVTHAGEVKHQPTQEALQAAGGASPAA